MSVLGKALMPNLKSCIAGQMAIIKGPLTEKLQRGGLTIYYYKGQFILSAIGMDDYVLDSNSIQSGHMILDNITSEVAKKPMVGSLFALYMKNGAILKACIDHSFLFEFYLNTGIKPLSELIANISSKMDEMKMADDLNNKNAGIVALREFKALLDAGKITQDEFEEKKKLFLK